MPFCGAAKNLARRTAPRALRKPAPCASTLSLERDWAVYCRMAFTAFGVRLGLASSISATVPATTGVAMLVPLRLRYGLYPTESVPFRRDGFSSPDSGLPGPQGD